MAPWSAPFILSLIFLFFSFAYLNGTKSAFSIPIYGNWCGLGHSGPGLPIDRIDTICMEHDMCYETHGMHYRGCDKEMLNKLSELKKHPDVSVAEVAIATLFETFFAYKPSDPGVAKAMKIIRSTLRDLHEVLAGRSYNQMSWLETMNIARILSVGILDLNALDLPFAIRREYAKLNAIGDRRRKIF